jgi:hypothetical protein
MFKKKAPKRSARGVGITAMLEDEVPGYAEGGEVKDDRAERERLAQMLLEQNREEFRGFAEGERPQMFRPPATMGMVQQPNPQQMQAAQMQQMAQMGMLPRFQEGGIVQAQPLSGWGSRITGWSQLFPRGANPEVSGGTIGSPAMDNPEFRSSSLTAMAPATAPATTPQQDSLASRLAARRSAEQQRLAAEEEAVQKRNQAQNDVFRSPEGQEAMDLMTQGRILNDPALYQKGRDALKKLTDTAYETRGAETGPLLPGGSAPVIEEPRYTPSAESGSPAGDTGGIMGGKMAPIKKKDAPPPPPPPGDRKSSDLSDIKSEREAKAAAARQENVWLALMQAGLAIAGGRSPNAITNIGQGGQAGLGSFMALEQQRRKDEDAATRRDLAEREYQLQVRRQNLQAPLLQAQAAYWQNRPAMDQARLVAQQQVARQRAQDAAQKAWKDEISSPAGQLKYMKMSDPAKQAAQELFLQKEFQRRYRDELSAFNAGVYGSPRETGPSSAEE